jgi:DNA-binding protein H-NS
MSIRPTDLQIIIQKTQEVEKLQQNQQQQSKVQQQQFAEQLHKQSEIKERQIRSSPRADEVKIQHKEKDAEKEQSQKRKQSTAQGDETVKQAGGAQPDEPEHMIDIKI